MRYLITGGTGFIGSALVASLEADGHEVTILSRRPHRATGRRRYVTGLEALEPATRFEAVINLAGASLADRRWTKAYKRELLASRLDTTRRLVAWLGRLPHRPATLLSASAIGYYGHHGDEPLDEAGAAVSGFAQSLCQRWEEEALAATQFGTRVCLLRFGVVLDAGGGAFEQMARPFRFGIANWLGSGRQWLSWVHRRDAVRAVRFLLEHPALEGPFNVTAPEPVTSRGFCDAMQRHRRTLITAPVPAPALRLLVGEMAEELLLQGQRVLPSRLQAAGFTFDHPALDGALTAILGR